jgi:hypothetical protein
MVYVRVLEPDGLTPAFCASLLLRSFALLKQPTTPVVPKLRWLINQLQQLAQPH